MLTDYRTKLRGATPNEAATQIEKLMVEHERSLIPL
jgi:hypothetical protein